MTRITVAFMLGLLAACSSPQQTAAPTPDPTPAVTTAASAPATQPDPSSTGPDSPVAAFLAVMIIEVDAAHASARRELDDGEVGQTASEMCRDTYDSFRKVNTPKFNAAMSHITVPVEVQVEFSRAHDMASGAFRDCIDGLGRAVPRLENARAALHNAALLIVPDLDVPKL